MGLKPRLMAGRELLRENGIKRTVREGSYFGYERLLSFYHSLSGRNSGLNVYNKDWDILVVLDACRYDLMEEVVSEFSYLPNDVPTTWSAGSTSEEWIENTFTKAKNSGRVSNTTLVSANPFTNQLDDDTLGSHVKAWDQAWDEELGTVLPDAVTDFTLEAFDEEERTVSWYMQPHEPFLSNPEIAGVSADPNQWAEVTTNRSVWERLRDGELSIESVWEAYRENLRIVLSSVEALAGRLDGAEMAITADHGNGLGEKGVYGHPEGVCTEEVRRVPYIEVNTDEVSSPDYTIDTSGFTEAKTDLDERLSSLGYK